MTDELIFIGGTIEDPYLHIHAEATELGNMLTK
jgi:hypothetical protein